MMTMDQIKAETRDRKVCLAEHVGNTPRELKLRLAEARAVLYPEYRRLFVGGRFDLKNKRLVSACERYALQWRLRYHPELEESYENQQTNRGIVQFVNLN